MARMAGDAEIPAENNSATFPDGAPIMDPKKDNIYSYDTEAFGAGAGKTERLSRADLKNLKNQGYSKSEIIDYATNIGETGVITDGAKAQKLLDKWKSKVGDSEEEPVTEIDVPAPDDDFEPITETPDPEIPPEAGIDPVDPILPPSAINGGSGNQIVTVTQDNDINNTGSGNIINQNNSVNTYGGNSNYSFNPYGFGR